MADLDPSTLTPIRQTRISISRGTNRSTSPSVNTPPPRSGAPDASTNTSSVQNAPSTNNVDTSTAASEASLLRAQLIQLQTQMAAMQRQMTTNRRLAESSLQTQSREYWTFPIADNISYPGENASRPAQIAYMQRLHAYLSKSQPVWNLVTGDSPCPITLNARAIAALQNIFGATWSFKNKDINRSLRALKENEQTLHRAVYEAMHKDSELPSGSWVQRNAALYNTISETLDLGKSGKDLDIIQLVDEINGVALHDLISFRLREIKSTGQKIKNLGFWGRHDFTSNEML